MILVVAKIMAKLSACFTQQNIQPSWTRERVQLILGRAYSTLTWSRFEDSGSACLNDKRNMSRKQLPYIEACMKLVIMINCLLFL